VDDTNSLITNNNELLDIYAGVKEAIEKWHLGVESTRNEVPLV
jgi:hypothetical protein